LILSIHKEYAQAGADILESNTFGANPLKLSLFGLADKVKEINRQGVALAKEAAGNTCYVAASIGPLGQELEPFGQLSIAEAKKAYKIHLESVLLAKPDLIIFETFEDLKELCLGINIAKEITPLPIIAQMRFGEDSQTGHGTTPEQMVAALKEFNLAGLGINCGVGPQMILDIAKKITTLTDLPVSAQPNAGLPKEVSGRRIYLSTPEYHAVYAKRMILSGITLVGGCCGTTPEHIKAIRNAVKALSPASVKVETTEKSIKPALESKEVPKEKKSPFSMKMSQGKFVVSVEISPPKGYDISKVIESVSTLKNSGIVDAINIPDGPRAIARMSPFALAVLLQARLGTEIILHYCCRDRNVLGIQADLLGMAAVGLNNVLAITGDPPKLGNYPSATAVFDVDSIGLTRIIKGLNRGHDLAENPINESTKFFIGVGANPAAIDIDLEIERLRQKVEAGAEYVLTQPVFDPVLLETFLKRIESFHIPVLIGVLPLVSYRNAEFLHNEVPGMTVPEKIRNELKKLDSPTAAGEYGIQVAKESLAATKGKVQGVYIMPPFGRVSAALKILEGIV
jgi:homocysteine S-methyltransferase